MNCSRCKGLMHLESTPDEQGHYRINLAICVNCGERVDPVILQNRTRPPGSVPPGAGSIHGRGR